MNNINYHLFDVNTVIVMTCSDCNTKCEHCYITYKGNFSKEQLTELVENFSDRFELRINGTEPLLHREYLEALQMAGQTKILTNGLVFKDNYDFLDLLREIGIKTIGISYHFDIHDLVSHVSKEYLDKLFDVIIEKRLNVQFMTTITSDTYTLVPDYKIYPCIFLINEENEIGFYENGKIFIRNDYETNTDECNAVLKLNRRWGI